MKLSFSWNFLQSLVILFFFSPPIFAQSPDTAAARMAIDRGNDFFTENKYDSAYIHYGKARLTFQNTLGRNHLRVGDSHFHQALAMFSMGDIPQALIHNQKASGIYLLHFDENHISVANTYYEIGRCYRKLSRFDEAFEIQTKALKIRESIFGPYHIKVKNTYQSIALIFQYQAKYNTALKYLIKAQNVLEQIPNPDDEDWASITHDIGVIYRLKGDFVRAIEMFEKSMSHMDPTDEANNLGIARTSHSLGNLYRLIGDLNKASELSMKSYNVWKSTNHRNLYISLMLLGAIAGERGDFDQVVHYNQQALTELQKKFGEIHPTIGGIYANLGHVYREKGEYEKALEYTQKSIDIRAQVLGEHHPSIADVYSVIGQLYEAKLDWDKALLYHRKSLDIYEDFLQENSPDIAVQLRLIGEVYMNTQQYGKAINSFELAATKLKVGQLDKSPILSKIYQVMSLTYLKTEAWEDALYFVELGIRALGFPEYESDKLQDLPFESASHPLLLLDLLKTQGACYLQKYKQESQEISDLEAAYYYYNLTVNLIDAQRDSYGSDRAKQIIVGKLDDVFDGGIETCRLLHTQTDDKKWLAQAFQYAEKNKAMTLFEGIKGADALLFAGIPDSVLAKEKKTRLALAFYKQSLFDASEEGLNASESQKEERYEFLEQVNILQNEYDSLILQIEHLYPEYYRLKHNQVVAELDQVEAFAKNSETTVIEYFLGDSVIYAFVVTPTATQLVYLPKGDHLGQQITQLRAHICDPFLNQQTSDAAFKASLQGYTHYADTLYRSLFGPIARECKLTDRLLIIPDGVMGHMPFDVLLQSLPKDLNHLKDFPYLINNHQIAYSYSSTLLLSLSGRKVSSNKLLAFAPEFPPKEGSPQYAAFRSDFSPLMYSKPEVEAVQGLMGGNVFVDNKATESKFKSIAPDYGIIHISSHAMINDENPLYSRIAFTPNNDSTEDGFLTVAELFNMRLNADMVVLSACETGSGKLYQGEGIVSLARGFIYAGTRSILTTLWRVNDAATADVMERFYEYLSEGIPKDVALRNAKISYIESADQLSAHPFYWAGYIPIGDMQPLPAKRNYLLWIMLGGLVIMGAVWMYSSKGRNS